MGQPRYNRAQTDGGARHRVDEIGAPRCRDMGKVHRARDPKLRREVALKILPVQSAADPIG